jgi:hypothetical protein
MSAITAVPITMSRIESVRADFAAGAVGIGAENDCPDRPGQIRQAKRSERQQERDHRVRGGEEYSGDGGAK